MGKLNQAVTNTALALWTKKDPVAELKKIGFKKATEVQLKPEDICLIVFLEENDIAFGKVLEASETHLTFTCYEQIRFGGISMNVKIPKKLFLVLKLELENQQYETV